MRFFITYRPALISLTIGLALTIIVSVFVSRKVDENIQSKSLVELNKAIARLDHNFSHQAFLFNWMAKQWQEFGQPEPVTWHQQAKHIIEHHEFIQAVEWADSNKVIRWIEPLIGNQQAFGLDLSKIPVISNKLDYAVRTGNWVGISNWKLVQGTKGILFYVPIGVKSENQGFVIGVVRMIRFLKHSLDDTIAKGYHIHISRAQDVIFSTVNRGFDTTDKQNILAKVKYFAFDEEWAIQIWPNQSLLNKQDQQLVIIIAITGLLITAFLAALSQLFISGRRFNNHLSKVNFHLQSEMSERKRIEQEKIELAFRDELTGLNNRSALYNYIEEKLKDKKPRDVAVILIDLDNFKEVNDVVGHHAGDMLIQKVAARLNKIVDKKDYLARIGGDEFAIFINEVPARMLITRLNKKLTHAIDTKFVLEHYEFITSACIGFVLSGIKDVTANELVRKADAALNQAKSLGRNCTYQYTDNIHLDILNKVEKLKKLNRAVENKQLELFYQPKINLNNSSIIGVEALLRWFDTETQTYIPPAEFVPLAEESGMILDIGEWVIDEACRQLSIWHQLGFAHLHVAINVSGRQLKSNRLYQHIVNTYEKYELRPQHIEIELTEEVFVDNIKKNEDFMRSLTDQGISLSIDDFGIGYSSLAYLKNFPITTLKIDRSFIRDVPENENDVSIVKAIIDLAKNMELKIVAEGVENKMQVAFLKHLQCHYAQGFWYSKALPARELTDKLIHLHNWD
ncbi:bifunctional diguanylate cyclase/phosphodiesterase [Catenovulum sediminis]|uniref:bifunctional diguanylate cyclase/phosphodiesterase n=1 Tax=Catenovulum sediminis TaxID=1740262 RepID=UPI00117EFEB8|nr:EAL domain-containing protein [Catenovulum sediminis]